MQTHSFAFLLALTLSALTPNNLGRPAFAGGFSNRHMLITASYSAYKSAP